jgi:lipoprotein signal peptidase
MVDLLPIWTSVFFTLAIYSFLYKENPWFRFAESVYAGVSVGYGVAFDLRYLRDQWGGQWSSSGTMMLLFGLAVLIGLLWYARFSKQYFFLYRWPLAIIVGTGIGMALRTVIFTQFLQQIRAQANTPLFVAGDMMQTFNNILIAIMVPCVLLYFWFTGVSRESAGMQIVEKVARYTMMAGFGSAFGYTVLTRMSLLIGRSQYLLGITPNPPEARMAFYTIAAIMLITLIGYDLYKGRS